MGEWIDIRDRMPTREDEDATGCILVYNVLNGVTISSSYNLRQYGGRWVTHWMPMPKPPEMDPAYKAEVTARV